MAATTTYDIAVKGDPKSKKLGDCPFCHRALLTLEEKKASYDKTYISFDNKPKWLFEVNPEGSVPVMKVLDDGKWVVGSGDIADYLEDQIPEPSLGKAEDQTKVASGILPKFVQFLTADKADEAEKQKALETELDELNKFLEGNGPYLGGDKFIAADAALSPKLHHIDVAAKALKGYSIPSSLTAVHTYIQKVASRPSWKATQYSDDFVIAGWKGKMKS
ncbi:hypothetical protein WJX73_009341 [Symbiochloris irregularis]|uniref:glutathione dehydrogenase (ascorbate) n=1 Tax=Symbiochloris irregularis TaxID=706552 RepID=A0AAW1PPX7_9CHLO